MYNIIFCKKSLIQRLFFWSNNFAIRDYITSNQKNVVEVENDILTAAEYRLADYESSRVEKKLYDKLAGESSIQLLSQWAGNDYKRRVIGQKIMQEAKKIFLSMFYAEAIIKKHNLKENETYLWVDGFELDIFRYLKKIGKIPSNIKILKSCYFYLYLKNKARFLYFFIKSLFFLEKKLLFKKNIKNIKKQKYKYFAYMEDGLRGWELPPEKLLIDNKDLQLDDVLFINRFGLNQKWISEYKIKNYHVFNLLDSPDLIRGIFNKWSYYKKYFMIRFSICFLILKYQWLSSTLFNAFKQRFLWDILYSKVKADNVISIMIADDITSSMIHKKHGTKSIFLYYSITTNVLKDIRKPLVSHCHDFTYMDYDVVISGKVSNGWLKTLQNNVNKYITLGPIFSDLIIDRAKNKIKMIKKLDIAESMKLIAFVDSPTGYCAVSNNKTYYAYLEALLELSSIYKSNHYFLKTKKNYNYIKTHSNKKIIKILDEIKNKKNITYANDLDLSAYDVIGISDLTISGSESSILYESFFAGKKTICYDPCLQYKNSDSIQNYIPKCRAFTFEDLIALHDYWLNLSDDFIFNKYLESNIDVFFDTKCGEGNNILKLRKLLYNDCIS